MRTACIIILITRTCTYKAVVDPAGLHAARGRSLVRGIWYMERIIHKVNRPNLGQAQIWVASNKSVNRGTQKDQTVLLYCSNYKPYLALYTQMTRAPQFTVLFEATQIRACPELGRFTLCIQLCSVQSM